MVEISDTGYWIGEKDLPHGIDKHLAEGLLEYFEIKSILLNQNISIVDVGCGTGFYTNYLNKSSKLLCHGYDGNPNTHEIAGENCGVLDFSKSVVPMHKYDFVLSLEVGEHIPPRYEDIFISNLDYLNRRGVVISWAIPEHGGDGHFNPRPNEYIIDRFQNLGYTFDELNTKFLRNSAAKYPNTGWWFNKTLMVFDRMDYDSLYRRDI